MKRKIKKVIIPVNSAEFCYFANSEEEVKLARNELQRKIDALFKDYGLTTVGFMEFEEKTL